MEKTPEARLERSETEAAVAAHAYAGMMEEQEKHPKVRLTESSEDDIRARKAQERRLRLERAKQRARETNTGLVTFLLVAGWAVRLAANTISDPEERRARRQMLLRKWQQYGGDLTSAAYR